MLVDVAFLTYNPDRDLHNPIVKLDSTCVAGVFELKKHKDLKRKHKYEMGTDAYKHYKWYNSCLKLECLKSDNGPVGGNTKLKILHWHIESSNIEAFKMQGVTYKAVSIIISPTVEYWYCANQGPNSLHTFGSRARGSSVDDQAQNACEIWFEPLLDHKVRTCSRVHLCKKNNCNECKKGTKSQGTSVKNPKYIKNKLEKENQSCNVETASSSSSSVLQAIELLNQKKNILRNGGVNGVPKVQNCKSIKKGGMNPIYEEPSY